MSNASMKSGDAHQADVQAAHLAALDDLFTESVAFFHRLKVVAELMHGQGELSGARRTMLKFLGRSGPVSVPQMARQNAVSRQAAQKLINDLAQEGLVEFIGNIAHKRSPLVRLTAQGREYISAMNAVEARLLARLTLDMSIERLEAAAQTVKEVRLLLESQQGLLAPHATIGTAHDQDDSQQL